MHHQATAANEDSPIDLAKVKTVTMRVGQVWFVFLAGLGIGAMAGVAGFVLGRI